MSILGIGIDIVENYRIKKILVNKKLKFKNKIFTKNEAKVTSSSDNWKLEKKIH